MNTLPNATSVFTFRDQTTQWKVEHALAESLKDTKGKLEHWPVVRDVLRDSFFGGEECGVGGVDWIRNASLEFCEIGDVATLGLTKVLFVLQKLSPLVSRSKEKTEQEVLELKRGILRMLSENLSFFEKSSFLKTEDMASTLAQLRILDHIVCLSNSSKIELAADLFFLLLQPRDTLLLCQPELGPQIVGFLPCMEGHVLLSGACMASPFSSQMDAVDVITRTDPESWCRNSLRNPWPPQASECLDRLRRRHLFKDCAGQLRLAVYLPELPDEYRRTPIRQVGSDDVLLTLDASHASKVFPSSFVETLDRMYSIHAPVTSKSRLGFI